MTSKFGGKWWWERFCICKERPRGSSLKLQIKFPGALKNNTIKERWEGRRKGGAENARGGGLGERVGAGRQTSGCPGEWQGASAGSRSGSHHGFCHAPQVLVSTGLCTFPNTSHCLVLSLSRLVLHCFCVCPYGPWCHQEAFGNPIDSQQGPWPFSPHLSSWSC